MEQRRAYIGVRGNEKAPTTMDTTLCAKPGVQSFLLENDSVGKYVFFIE